MKKKHTWIKVVAIVAAITAVAAAVAVFLKKKGKKVQQELDFDEDLYFGAEDDFDDDILNGDDTVILADADDDMMPIESEDAVAEENKAE